MIKKILKWFFNFVMNRSYRKSRVKDGIKKHNGDLDIPRTMHYSKELAKIWQYKNDGILGLRNRINPQSQPFVTKGDCDDFASSVLGRNESLKNGYLVSYFPEKMKKTHTVPVFRLPSGKYLVINWSRQEIFSNWKDVLEYFKNYSSSNFLYGVYLAQWDNKKGKYVKVNEVGEYVDENN